MCCLQHWTRLENNAKRSNVTPPNLRSKSKGNLSHPPIPWSSPDGKTFVPEPRYTHSGRRLVSGSLRRSAGRVRSTRWRTSRDRVWRNCSCSECPMKYERERSDKRERSDERDRLGPLDGNRSNSVGRSSWRPKHPHAVAVRERLRNFGQVRWG